MTNHGIIFLMYHELELVNRELCNSDNGYKQYVIAETVFKNQMLTLKQQGFSGINVSQALTSKVSGPQTIVLTFDDGCETDLIAAAPILKEFNFTATFYVIGGWIGRKGYLAKSQVRELADLGFEIGSHSMTHQYLTDINRTDLKHEIADSKDLLEQLSGRSVQHFSCPGGRWNPLVAESVASHGYLSMATSRIGTNQPLAHPFSLSRISIVRSTTTKRFANLCRADGLIKMQIRDAAFSLAKVFLGNKFYEVVRNKFFEFS
ncbi:MAG: polysaccharide deacetylase family protein [Acidobacteria bacterium]|nr:polysaccharide deacetylase family protein [Acidobacteriota bacterium]